MNLKKNIQILFLLLISITYNSNASNYYWVGGSGIWSDVFNHWATSSGGTSPQSSVPTQLDNVIFDVNSGVGNFTVTLDAGQNNCKNMDWSGVICSPILNRTTGFLVINGSLVLKTGMQFLLQGSITQFVSNTIATITSNSVVLEGHIDFGSSSSSCSYTLNDNLTLGNLFGGTLSFVNGTLNSNNKTINTLAINGNTNTFTITLGSSIVNTYSWVSDGGNLTVNPGSSQINILGFPYGFWAGGSQLFNNVTFLPTTSGDVASMFFGNFNTLTFMQDGNVGYFISANNLILASSHRYGFSSSTTGNTIYNSIVCNTSACSGLAEIYSSSQGSQAKFFMVGAATASVTNAMLTDIFISNATFANGCFDMGGNTGWTFSPNPSQNFYWIGGSGDWNNPAHWSTNCIPTPVDNVFFDAGSGISPYVTVSSGNAYCKDITWSGVAGTPTLACSFDVNIFGSLTFQTGMLLNINGRTFNFLGNATANTINMNNVVVDYGNVNIGNYNRQGTYSLTNSFLCNAGMISLYNGSLNSNNNYIRITNFGNIYNASVNSPQSFSLTLGSSTIDCTSFLYGGTTGFVNAGTSQINISADRLYLLSVKTNEQYYNVTFKTNPTYAYSNFGILSGGNFHKVIFEQHGNLVNAHIIDSLIFAPSNKYILPSLVTSTITGAWISNAGSCSGLTEIKSNNLGTQALIKMLPGAVTNITNVMLTDVNISGPLAPYSAPSSLDMGNNTGWFLAPNPVGKNLYWVGGTGNWNDGAHWSLTSGGVYPSTTGCVPTPFDDVYFDASSNLPTNLPFTTSILTSSGFCHNMTWTLAPMPSMLTMDYANQLNIYGSSILQNNMVYYFPAPLYSNPGETNYLSSSLTESITSNDVQMKSLINIGNNLRAGGYILTDSLSITQSLLLNNGSLNTNNNLISVPFIGPNIACVSPQSFSLSLGSSKINTSNFSFFGANKFQSAGSSLINIDNRGINYYGIGSYRVNFNAGAPFHNISYLKTLSGLDIGFLSGGNFTKTTFYQDGIMPTNHVFDTLILNSSYTYFFNALGAQTINNKLYANGNPCFLTYLKSTNTNSKANIEVLGGGFSFDYCNVQDINANTNSLSFLGHSTNNGNNSNITFAPTSLAGLIGLGSNLNLPCSALPYTINTYSFYPSLGITTFTWSDGSHANSLVTNSGGNYNIVVDYGKNCVVRDTITITKSITIPLSAFASQTIICNGALVTLNASNVNTYTWSTGQNTSTIIVTPTVSTNYSVTGSDVNGCVSSQTLSIVVNSNPTITVNSQQNVMCYGGSSGFVNITTTGGNGGLTLSPSTNSLLAGNYNYLVIDNLGCTDTKSIVITQPNAVLSSITATVSSNTNCLNNNGVATVTVTGGAPSYTVNWSSGALGNTANNLNTGINTYTIIDANGCQDTNGSVYLGGVVGISLSAINQKSVNCFGLNTGATSFSTTGSAPSYTLVNSINMSVIINSTGTFTNLSAGSYSVFVIASGCANSQIINIGQPMAPLNILGITSNSIACFGNTTTVGITVTGGTAPYNYTWSSNSSNANTANHLSGNFTVSVTDANNCTTTAQAFSVSQPSNSLSLLVIGNNPTCKNKNSGAISVLPQGGTPNYSIVWSNGANSFSRLSQSIFCPNKQSS